jgi:CRP-like cAMP-binding protein
MLSLEQKLELMRSISLFMDTTEAERQQLASLLEEVDYPANTLIFAKDSHGDCLYIVAKGVVRVHDEDRTLNYISTGEVFGEMALLDAQPRVASVTVIEDAVLLRLDQEPFYELMADYPQVARGVIRMLTQRLRARVHDMHEDYLYIQAMNAVTGAAMALESGKYDTASIAPVMARGDALGHLAVVFDKVANEMQTREKMLKQEVQSLRIKIDQSKKEAEVSQIVESEYFRDLQSRVKQMKRPRQTGEQPPVDDTTDRE